MGSKLIVACRRTSLTLLLSLAGFALCTKGALADASTATARLCDGRSVAGTIIAIAVDVVSLSVDGAAQSIPRDDLVSLDLASGDAQRAGETWLLFSNGDRAPLVPVDLMDDALVCRWETGRQRANCRVPLELVTGLLRQPLHAPDDSSLVPELSRRSFRDDTLILSDGTRLSGALEGVTADAFQLETAVGIVPVETARVVAVAMNAALIQRPPMGERAALVTLRDGTWLTLFDLVTSDADTLTGRTVFDADLSLARTSVTRIAFFGPNVSDLTQRPLQQVETVPFVSRTSPPLVNRNVRGGWLRLGGREFPRGLGMTSGTSATFALEPDDRRFQATVGLDDSVGAAGSVVFAVDLDGRRVFTSPTMRGGDAPLIIGPLDVTGGSALTLTVEFAEFGHVQDVANWCEPVILR